VSILAGVIPTQTHPHIELDLAVSNLFFDLTKLAADVAVRPADKPPEGLTGRRVSTVAFAIARNTWRSRVTRVIWRPTSG
jgi:hypothetical protein